MPSRIRVLFTKRNEMAKIMMGVLLLAGLAACASPQVRDYNEWVQNGRARAEHGDIKWSDYYQGCFSRLADLPNGVMGKSVELDYYNTMIANSLEYENGRITKQEFEEKGRLAQITKARNKEAQIHARPGPEDVPHPQTTY
jgi:hypothetical protein